MENEPTKSDELCNETESAERTDVTIDDVFALLSGTASVETRKRIAKAMYDPNHPLSYFARQSSDDEAFQAEWPPKNVPDAIRDLLND